METTCDCGSYCGLNLHMAGEGRGKNGKKAERLDSPYKIFLLYHPTNENKRFTKFWMFRIRFIAGSLVVVMDVPEVTFA